MKKIYCNYKILGGFGLMLGLNVLMIFGSYKLLISSKISVDKVDLINDRNALFAYCVIIGLTLLFLLLFVTQCRFIMVDKQGITTINPLLPFLKRTYGWNEFDYYVAVEESSQYSTHEAIWLISGDRLKVRFSSFYYSNYDDLVDQIPVRSRNDMSFSPFDQLLILIGLKKTK